MRDENKKRDYDLICVWILCDVLDVSYVGYLTFSEQSDVLIERAQVVSILGQVVEVSGRGSHHAEV